MTFSRSGIIPDQAVVLIFRFKYLVNCELTNDIF